MKKCKTAGRFVRHSAIRLRKPKHKTLNHQDPLFTEIATILHTRGIRTDYVIRRSLYQIAVQNARPGFPARDVLLQIKKRLRNGTPLSAILSEAV